MTCRRSFLSKFALTKFALSLLSAIAINLPAQAALPDMATNISLPAAATASALQPSNVVPNEVLVKFGSALSAQSMKPTMQTMASGVKQINHSGLTLVKLKPGTETISSAMATLRAMPGVVSVQPNFIYHAAALPNDPQINQQWALKNTGQTVLNATYGSSNPGTQGDDIDAEGAWQYQSDCSSVIVAVIDTGINYTQQDLVNSMWNGGPSYPHHGYDFVDNDNNPYPTTADELHGTHVAGIIGAEGNNGIEGSGVCQKASIMSIRSLDASGGTTATVTQGIYFAVDHGAKIINLSLGGSGKLDQAFSDAIDYAQSKGVLVVVAAGNGDDSGKGVDVDQTPFYPCAFPQNNLICVAALDQSFQLASFSNYGATSVDVGAPGTNILSTIAGPTLTTDFSSGWFSNLGSNTGWGFGKTTSGIPVLVNPVAYGTSNYASGTDDRIWTDFTFAPSIQHIAFSYYLQGKMASGDYLNSGVVKGSNTDPFSGGGHILQHISGTLSPPQSAFPIDQCLNTTCSLGFQLTSTASSPGDTGPLIGFFNLNTIEQNTTAMGIENGTSMAAPVVSGIAALLMASDPTATDIDVAKAIEQSGTALPSLSGITTTGRVVNAMNALAKLHLKITGLGNISATSGQTRTVPFSIGGLGALTVSTNSNNPGVISNSAITGQNTCTQAGNCTLEITPAAAGTSTIGVTVADTFGQQTTSSFLVTVASANGGSGGGGGMNGLFLLLLASILGASSWRNARRHS